MRHSDYQEAFQLYTIAQRSVQQYTSWFLEYTYYRTLCQQKLNERLLATERQQVQEAIKQGRLLSQHRTS
jgi:hypothetical protein